MNIREILSEVAGYLSPVENDPSWLHPHAYVEGVAREVDSDTLHLPAVALHAQRFAEVAYNDLMSDLVGADSTARSDYAGRMDARRMLNGERPETVEDDAYRAGMMYGLEAQAEPTPRFDGKNANELRSFALGMVEVSDTDQIENPWLL